MTTSKEINEFFERQSKLLREERDAEAAQNALLLSKCSPKLLEQRGLALLNLIPVNISIGIGGRNLIELSRNPAVVANPDAALPPHSFRPGDIASLEKTASNRLTPKKASEGRLGAPNERLTEGVVYKVTESRIVLAIDPRNRQDNEDLDLPNVCNLVKLANTATNDRMAKVISALQASLTEEASSNNRVLRLHPDTLRLFDVMLGLKSPDAVEIDNLNLYDETLNESQRRAIQFALGSKEVACIHGPPGTGKTHTLLEIIRQSLCPRFAQESFQILRPVKKMLVCGSSNLSVDNILERLLLPPLPGMRPIKCTRLGHPARVKGQASSLDATLDFQSSRSEGAELVKDIKTELSENLLLVSGHAKGQKGRKPRGEERKKLWEEIKALRQEYRRREKGVVNTILSEAEVVFATCHTAGGRAIEHMQFDIVIIDEATQALEAACWIPIIKGKKVILAGDPLQLPPTVLAQPHSSKKERTTKQQATGGSKAKSAKTAGSGHTDDESETSSESLPDVRSINLSGKSKPKSDLVLRPSKDLSMTLFERLEKMYGKSIKRMLEIQYRMHEKICEFPSKALYGSRLHSDASVAHHLLLDLPGTSKDRADLLSSPVVFLDTSGSEYYERSVEEGDEGSKYNENEAVLVKAWLEKLVAAGIHPSQIAVITPYQAQVSYISSLLSGVYGSELEIGTVDGMQGREKEAIIISLVRSNNKREVGFLKDKRRLNVAMTRARRHMCVIGDSSTVQHGSKFLKEWMSWLEDSAEVYFGGLDELP